MLFTKNTVIVLLTIILSIPVSSQPENDKIKASSASTDIQTEQKILLLQNRDHFYNVRDDQTFMIDVIKMFDKKTYWIKSGMIYDKDEKVMLVLSDYVKDKYGTKLVEQLPAEYGYIVEIIDDEKINTTSIAVSLADQNGERNSDELIINTSDLKNLTFR